MRFLAILGVCGFVLVVYVVFIWIMPMSAYGVPKKDVLFDIAVLHAVIVSVLWFVWGMSYLHNP